MFNSLFKEEGHFMEYQMNFFNETRQYESTQLTDYRCFTGVKNFVYGEKNIIFGPNGSGKSTLIRALYITAGVGSINWSDLNLFSDNKWIEVLGICTTGISKRRRKYRNYPKNLFGIDPKKMTEVSLKNLKRNIGMYEHQRLLFSVINKKFINEYSPKKRLSQISKLNPLLDLKEWVEKTNNYFSFNCHNFRLKLEDNKLLIVKGSTETPLYSSGHVAILIICMVFAAAEQLGNPPIILDEDYVPTYSLDREAGKNFIDIVVTYKGQVFLEQCFQGEIVKQAKTKGFHFINLELPSGDKNTVSKRIATRAYVADTDLSFTAKVRLADEMIVDALHGKKKPVIAWSGGLDSTFVLYLVRKRLADIPVLRILTGNTHPTQETFCRKLQKEWRLNTQITDKNNNLISTLLRSETNIWQIIEKYGFPLLPKSARASNTPYYNAAKEHCRICSNNCCYFLKEKPAKLLYSQCDVDLVFRGLTGEESQSRKMNLALGGYVKYVAEYNSTMADVIAPFSKEEIIFAHKNFHIPWAELYDIGFSRSGCINCGKSVLYSKNNLLLLKQDNPKYWDFLMVTKGLARELSETKIHY